MIGTILEILDGGVVEVDFHCVRRRWPVQGSELRLVVLERGMRWGMQIYENETICKFIYLFCRVQIRECVDRPEVRLMVGIITKISTEGVTVSRKNDSSFACLFGHQR
jgi:hypothetical protein